MVQLRHLRPEESDAAADIHRIAGALIPGYDTAIHTADEFRTFYRDKVLQNDTVWGAFLGELLVGHVALLPGWIDHLYVAPNYHGQGVGSRLVTLAQSEQAELRLYTFQSNIRARDLYERHGFVVEELTNSDRNEEKMPDATYHWVRS